MADVPIWVLAGELLPGGSARAEKFGLPHLTHYREDAFVAVRNPRFDWIGRHAAGTIPVFVWNYHGVQAAISSIADNGDGTSRVTLAGPHGRAGPTFPVVLSGIVSTAGTDWLSAGTIEATYVDATSFDVPMESVGGSHAFAATPVAASGGRTIQFWEAESLTHPAAFLGRPLLRASSGDFLADGYRPGQDLIVVDTATSGGDFTGAFTILEVTATDIALREVANGWRADGGPFSSGIALSAASVCKVPSADVLRNPLIGPNHPNGHTNEEHTASGRYPSETHGFELTLLAYMADDFETGGSDSKLFPGLGAPWQTAYVLSLSGGQGPFGSDHDHSFGIDEITIDATKTLLKLQSAHGLSGTERVFVFGIPADQEPSLTGYHLATVEDAVTLSIPIVSTAVPDSAGFQGALGTVALRELAPASAAAVADTLEITTTAAHGLETGDEVWIGGVVGHDPDDLNGRWKITKIDSDTFSIPLKTVSVSPTIGAGWISSKFRHARAYSCGSNPVNGGQYWDMNSRAIRWLMEWIAEFGGAAQPFVAGIWIMGGYNDDDDAGGNVVGTNAQIDRFGRSLEELARDYRDVAWAIEETNGQQQHADVSDIPVICCPYVPNPKVSSGDPSRTVGGKLIANVNGVRAQTAGAAKQIGGRVGVYDGALDGFETDVSNIQPTVDSLVRNGRGLWTSWLHAWRETAAPSATENRAPVYVFFGQSQAVGTVPAFHTFLGGDPNYDGSHYDPATGKVRPGDERQAYIWHHGAGEFQEYTTTIAGAAGNANTHPIHNPTQTLNFGPEASLILKLRERHPEGVYLVKLAVGSSALAPVPGLPTWDPDTATLYTDLVAAVRASYRWLVEERGLIPDLRGFVFLQGESDSSVPYGDEYQARLETLISRVRFDLGTRSSAEPQTPFVIGGLNIHERYPFDPVEGAKVQAAQQAVAGGDVQAVYVSMQSITIRGSDDTHYSGQGTIEAGLRLGGIAWAGLGTYLAPKVLDLYLKDDEFGAPQLGATVGDESGGEGGVPATADATILTGSNALERAQQIVELCDEAIAAGLDVLSYSVNGRTVTRHGLSEIRTTRDYYQKVIRNLSGYRRTFATFGGS